MLVLYWNSFQLLILNDIYKKYEIQVKYLAFLPQFTFLNHFFKIWHLFYLEDRILDNPKRKKEVIKIILQTLENLGF